MKKLLLTVYLLNFVFCFSQEKLIVEYESRMEFDVEAFEKNMDLGDVKVGKDEIINALKESMLKPSYFLLTLTPSESEFKFVEKISNDQPKEGRVRITMSAGGRGITYKNLNESLLLRTEDAFNQKFLIKDSLSQYDWKISRESKEILGYEVRKAETTLQDSRTAIAWYAPKLAYKNGPSNYQGLPGLILKIEITDLSDEEKRKEIFEAISVKVDTENKTIQRPEKGKIVNSSEFDEFLEKQSQKMNEMYGGGVDKD